MFPNFGELFQSLDRAEGEAKAAFREFMQVMEHQATTLTYIESELSHIATEIKNLSETLERVVAKASRND